MSERSVLRLLKKNYPAIYDELSQKPVLDDLERVGDLVRLFLQVKSIPLEDLVKNRDQSRMQFITVVVKAYDPVFFIDQDKTLVRGLREKLASVLYCHETQISHTLSTVRTYLRVYKHFREEVGYIYGKTVNVLKDESANHLQGA
ncbi:MAG: hypothetical protein RBT74_10775 [Tenuifilaceae bacterium]|jgi:hypothetical protein|nr:hypothetical protein [Tenuifilaceae bacterium]